MVDLSHLEVPVGTTKLILVLRILYLFYEVYPSLTVLIRFLRILFLCEGTRKYNESEQVWIISHIRSYQIQGQIRLLQIRTLVFRRFRSQIHYTEVIIVTIGLILIRTSCRYYGVLLMQNLYL